MACEISQMDAGEVIYGAEEIVSEMVEEATGPVDLSVLKDLKVNFDFLAQVPHKNISVMNFFCFLIQYSLTSQAECMNFLVFYSIRLDVTVRSV